MNKPLRSVGPAILIVAGLALIQPRSWGQEETAAVSDVGAYVVAAGDVLEVGIYDEERLSGEYRVDLNGNIFVPDVGDVKVAGYTLKEAQERLTERLKIVLKHPVVALRLNEASSRRNVHVVGAVNLRGTFDLPVGATVIAAIAKAQGFSDAADPSHVLLVRATGDVRELNLGAEDIGASPDARTPLYNGDMISVPISQASITVLGPVNRPGRFAIRPDRRPTILEAIGALAQGPAPDSTLGTATVYRKGEPVQTIDIRRLLVEGDLSLNIELMPGDIVQVEQPEAITVLGAVNTPLSFVPGPVTTVIDAVSRAGGLTPLADLRHATIRRGDEAIPVDLSALWVEGDMAEDVRLKPGDVFIIPETANEVIVAGEVKQPGAITYVPGMRAASVISQAGGPTELGDLSAASLIRDEQKVPLDLESAMTTGEGGGNVPLRPGDVIHIPPRAHAYILGAVNQPGPHPVHKGDTIMDALSDAGGTSARANNKRMLLARRDESGAPVLLKFDLAQAMARSGVDPQFDVQAGDVIFVPVRGSKRTWSNARDAVWMLTGIGGLLLR